MRDMETMRVAYIYILRDPRDWRIRYVGKTVQPLDRRLFDHIRQSKRGDDLTKNTRHDRWINVLIGMNLKPILEMVEMLPDCDSIGREKWLISRLKELGHDLVNGNAGGGGCTQGKSKGFGKWTDEHRKRHSLLLTGRRHTEEEKRKIRETNLKFWRENPHTEEHKRKISEGQKRAWKQLPKDEKMKRFKRQADHLSQWRSVPGNEEFRIERSREYWGKS
jgi:hypothetical protein